MNEREKKTRSFRSSLCFVEYTRQTNVFNLVKEWIYFNVGSRRTFEKKKHSFLFMLNNRHVQMIEKKTELDTHSHTELFVQWIKCRHRWLGIEIDSLFTKFFLSFSLYLFEKITFVLILSCLKGFSRLFSSMGQKAKDKSKITYRIPLNRSERKKEKKWTSFFLFQGIY